MDVCTFCFAIDDLGDCPGFYVGSTCKSTKSGLNDRTRAHVSMLNYDGEDEKKMHHSKPLRNFMNIRRLAKHITSGAFAKRCHIEFDFKATDHLLDGPHALGTFVWALEQLLITINKSKDNVFVECYNSSPSAYGTCGFDISEYEGGWEAFIEKCVAGGGNKAKSDMTAAELVGWESGGKVAHVAKIAAAGDTLTSRRRLHTPKKSDPAGDRKSQ